MLIPLNPQAGDTYTRDGFRWVWVAQDVERGHWQADDATGITVFPANDGIDEVYVIVPTGRDDEERIELRVGPDELDAAFAYAARRRLARAN